MKAGELPKKLLPFTSSRDRYAGAGRQHSLLLDIQTPGLLADLQEQVRGQRR